MNLIWATATTAADVTAQLAWVHRRQKNRAGSSDVKLRPAPRRPGAGCWPDRSRPKCSRDSVSIIAIAIGSGATATGLVATGAAASTANGGAAFGDGAVATGSWAGSPRIWCWRDHSAGRSARRTTPMPCGRRPSIPALTKKPAVSGLFRRVSTHQFAAFQATCSDDRTAGWQVA
jgi:hypothetical protein